MRMIAARAVCECLLEQGVSTVFAYPGGQALPLFDALHSYRRRIKAVLPAHEQGGAHMADGYARATGKTGVCIATSGPGATNLITGIAAAYMDSSPVVFITGNVLRDQVGTDAFQEVDIVGMTMGITKHGWLVTSPAELVPTLRKAFKLSREGRPGPVLIDIPRDVQTALIDYLPPETSANNFAQTAEIQGIKEAAALIAECERPLLLAGGGVLGSGAWDSVMALAERLQSPVAGTLMGLTAFPASHPLHLGLVGTHGTQAANQACGECDLLIAVGTRFSDRVMGRTSPLSANARVLHIDIDRAEVFKNLSAAGSVVGDAREAVSKLLQRLPSEARKPWLRHNDKVKSAQTSGLTPHAALLALRKALPADAFVATDVGQHQIWTAQFFPFETPRTLLTSGGLGAMGFGLGAAIGAQLGFPNRAVALVTGDGSFRMNSPELATVAAQRLPILIMVMNNGVLGMVRQLQTLYYKRRYYQTDAPPAPDFVALASAYGIEAHAVSNAQTLYELATKCVKKRKPMLLDCRIDKDILAKVTLEEPL